MRLARLPPAAGGPEHVGPKPVHLRPGLGAQDVEREVGAGKVGKRLGLEELARAAHVAGHLRDAGIAQSPQRLGRLAVHQPDHGQPGGDGRPLRAGNAVVDLMLQHLRRLVEKVELHQPVGQPPDDLVAPPAHRHEFLEVVEQRHDFAAAERGALAAGEQLVEMLGGFVMQPAGDRMVREHGRRLARQPERVPPALVLDVDVAEFPQRLDLRLVAAPGDRQRLQPRHHLLARDRIVVLAVGELHSLELRPRGHGPHRRVEERPVARQRGLDPPRHFIELGLHQRDLIAVEPHRHVLVEQAQMPARHRLVLHGDGGAQRFRADHRLEMIGIAVENRRRAPESGEGAGIAARARVVDRAPEVRLQALLEAIGGQRGLCLLGPMHHGVGHALHEPDTAVAPPRRFLGDERVERPERFHAKPVGEQMSRERDPGAGPFGPLRRGGGPHQLRHLLARGAKPHLFPFASLDDQAGLRGVGRRRRLERGFHAQGQPAAAGDGDVAHIRAHGDVIRHGAHHHPLHGLLDLQLDETLRLGHRGAWPDAGSNRQLPALLGADPVNGRHAGDRHAQHRLAALVEAALRPEHGRGRDAGVSHRQRPSKPIWREPHHARALELEPQHHGPALARATRLLDKAGRGRGDPLRIDLVDRVEHDHRLAPVLEGRGGRAPGKQEVDALAVGNRRSGDPHLLRRQRGLGGAFLRLGQHRCELGRSRRLRRVGLRGDLRSALRRRRRGGGWRRGGHRRRGGARRQREVDGEAVLLAEMADGVSLRRLQLHGEPAALVLDAGQRHALGQKRPQPRGIELHRSAHVERDRVVDHVRLDRNVRRQVEHKARQGRQTSDPHVDLSRFLRGADAHAAAHHRLRRLRPAGEVDHDLGGQTRKHSLPAGRDQVDENPLRRLDLVRRYGPLEREAGAEAVRVDTRDGDVGGHLPNDPLDLLERDRLAEADDEHAAGHADAGGLDAGQGEDDAPEIRLLRALDRGPRALRMADLWRGGGQKGRHAHANGPGTHETRRHHSQLKPPHGRRARHGAQPPEQNPERTGLA